MVRVLITGGVGTGKTTLSAHLAAALQLPTLATDDALWLPEVVTAPNEWAAANAEVATWIMRSGPWLIEGTRVPHALALAIRQLGRGGPPLFTPPLVYLTRARHVEDRRAAAMTASTLAATRHCERRLGVPTLWTPFEDGLVARLLEIMRWPTAPA